MDQAYLDAAHLFKRAGFGALHEELEVYRHWGWTDLVDMVLDTSRAPAAPPLPDLSEGRSWHLKWTDMVHYWLDLARRPVDQAPVVEKMVLFWHGVLCTSLKKTHRHRTLMEQNVTFRNLGLGSYHTLLHAVARQSAMIEYLDNDRNVAGKPNENFARELMELFGTGVGHYSETDVVESARAWTGHGVDANHHYRFHPEAHDWGSKTFMGQTGNFDGPDVINIMLGQRRAAHARFMCRKLWSFFAYPVELDAPEVTDIMATYSPGLNIRATLRAIFLHPKFRSERARTGLVRSPIEFMVAAMRHTSLNCDQAHPEWVLSEMGQAPFMPPDVSGWRQNEYWINSTTSWGKGKMASQIRWKAYNRNDIRDVNEITDWSTMTYKYTPEQAVNLALWNYKLGAVSSASRQALVDYVRTERNSDKRWGERAGLLMLPLLLPEMQMA